MSKRHHSKFKTRKYRKVHPGQHNHLRFDPNALEPRIESRPIDQKNIQKRLSRIKPPSDSLPGDQNDLTLLAIKKDLIQELLICLGLIVILIGMWFSKDNTVIFEKINTIIFHFIQSS